MNTLSLIVLSVLVLTFGTLQAFPQHGVDLESGAMGGGAEAGAGAFGGATGAKAGAQGGASRSGGVSSLRGPGGLISVSSGSFGGMAQAKAGTSEGAAGASVQAQGGGADSDAAALGADGGSTNVGSGASGGAAQAAADTVGDEGQASSGAVGGSADSGANILGEDGGLINVGTGASGGIADAGVVNVGEVASVHTASLGGGADSAVDLAGNPKAEQTAEVAPTPTQAEPAAVGNNPAAVAVAEPVADEEEGFVFGEDPVAEEVPSAGLTAEGDSPIEILKPEAAVIVIPNGDDSPIELIVPLLPADNANEEVKDAEDSETPPGQRRFLPAVDRFVDAADKGLKTFVDALTQKSAEAAPVNSEADV